MDSSTDHETDADAIAALFASTFTASGGAEEGALIGALGRRPTMETPTQDLRVVTAWEDGAIPGSILCTRITCTGHPREVLMRAPVAVATARQDRPIGEGLIAHGLNVLRQEGVDIAVTHGDPEFYGRVGFKPVSEAGPPAPQPLQQPQVRVARSLADAPLVPSSGPARCVAALGDPALWSSHDP